MYNTLLHNGLVSIFVSRQTYRKLVKIQTNFRHDLRFCILTSFRKSIWNPSGTLAGWCITYVGFIWGLLLSYPKFMSAYMMPYT